MMVSKAPSSSVKAMTVQVLDKIGGKFSNEEVLVRAYGCGSPSPLFCGNPGIDSQDDEQDLHVDQIRSRAEHMRSFG
ncbi:unnamed protein product [Microthlaspi erraticum]|uniref:Uncharacterized protein n=1 Tax=Microthlaspi erraticum TaxID=1685480 RepID=A0A6D2IMN3_9BRAS|nr:unnamed protein product [Microthlaspi erraticum]